MKKLFGFAVVAPLLVLAAGSLTSCDSKDADEEYEEILPGFEDDTQDDTQEFNEQDFTVNGVTFKMIAVEGGTYKMGCNDGKDGYLDEKPVHDETVATFQIGKTEVTQELWQAVMGTNPSFFKGEANLPVEQVSWTDCNTFIAKLNQATGNNFRLPTEAEWEYAARGGNQSQGYTYSGSNTIGDVAWSLADYGSSETSKTNPVAKKQPNELGIYDMTGNVYEWTSDKYSKDYSQPRTSSYRVFRGGACYNGAYVSRVACRSHALESSWMPYIGLRLAL